MEEANNIKRKLLEALKELSQQKINYSKQVEHLEKMLVSARRTIEQISLEFKEYKEKYPNQSNPNHDFSISKTPQNTQLGSQKVSSNKNNNFKSNNILKDKSLSFDNIDRILTSILSPELINKYSEVGTNIKEIRLEEEIEKSIEKTAAHRTIMDNFLNPKTLIKTLLKEGEWDIQSLVEILNLDEGKVLSILKQLHNEQLIKYDLQSKKVFLI